MQQRRARGCKRTVNAERFMRGSPCVPLCKAVHFPTDEFPRPQRAAAISMLFSGLEKQRCDEHDNYDQHG